MKPMKKLDPDQHPMQCGFTVYLAGRFYDEVFFDSDMSDYEVKQSLINHDGYPPTIRVYKTK